MPPRPRLQGRAPWWVVALALALLLAPAAALAHVVPEWSATNDPALMGLRALDVGTARTPLVGQPSQSGLYTGGPDVVHHPGPVHLYLLAIPVRVLGPALGMPLVSAVVTGTCLVAAAWVARRLLGDRGALVATLGLALVTFTTGTASLVNPVSSSIAGYPLLLTAVLAWAVAAGDVRLLPLATAAASFTAQQHLAVVPATVVLVVGGTGLGALGWWHDGRSRDPAARRQARRAVVASAVVALVLWAPVLVDQAVGDGNLGDILWFARHGNGDTVGMGSAAGQVAHAVGLPPLLGSTDADGWRMISPPSPLTWATAAAMLALVALLTWRHRTARPRAALGAMTGVALVAGLLNGSSVPEGLEKTRLAFYHWAFVLAFLVVLVVGTAVADRVAARGRRPARGRPAAGRQAAAVRPVAAMVVALATTALAVVSPRMDRPQNTAAAAYSTVPSSVLDRLADEVVDHRRQLGRHPVLLSRGEATYGGAAAGLALLLACRGVDVAMPLSDHAFVHDQRLVDHQRLDSGLLLVASGIAPGPPPPGGQLLARVPVAGPFPTASLARLVAAASRATAVVDGPGTARALEGIEDGQLRHLTTLALRSMVERPRDVLLNVDVLEVLARAPLAAPVLDPRDVDAVHDALVALDGDGVTGRTVELQLYLLDREGVLGVAHPAEVGPA
ncbi:MAG TPA: hypothetical protein VFW63_12120 [Acidimicrobiales bacterium]|nr:hypothetical protein [Acidimicrobiales bacterium]